MSMVFVPKSAQAQVPFVAADFPAVKHFFPCDEVAATNTLSDVVGDVVINYAGLTRTGDGFGVESTSTSAQAVSGTWSTPGTKPFVLFVVGSWAATGNDMRVGASTGTNINLEGTAPVIVVEDLGSGVGQYDGDPLELVTANTIYGRAMTVSAYNTATGQRTYEFDTSTIGTAETATPTDNTSTGTVALTTMPALTLGALGFTLQGTTSALYGMVFMEFTSSLPADLLVGLAWMTAEFAAGNKVIYPAWKGLS